MDPQIVRDQEEESLHLKAKVGDICVDDGAIKWKCVKVEIDPETGRPKPKWERI